MLKTRGQGYDGKGQRVIHDASAAALAHAQLGNVPCILEAFVPFDFEISLIAVRAKQNASPTTSAVSAATTLFYPPCRNQHINGILHQTTVPAIDVDAQVLRYAQAAMEKMMETMQYEGVLCVEFFVLNTPAGQQLIANEMAPRVHNSGHWSIEGAHTSQFTNHIRAITRQELGSTALRAPSVMINLVGDIPEALTARKSFSDHRIQIVPGDHARDEIDNVSVHIYGKSPRAGRKLGHITAIGQDAQQRAHLALTGH
jgi:5-(carboxyamino)imidazole ribonucleotide synthase